MREFCLRFVPMILDVRVGFVRVCRNEPLKFEVPSEAVIVVDMV